MESGGWTICLDHQRRERCYIGGIGILQQTLFSYHHPLKNLGRILFLPLCEHKLPDPIYPGHSFRGDGKKNSEKRSIYPKYPELHRVNA